MHSHTLVAHGIRMRHCHYCNRPISTAFYLSPLHKWACAPCYVEHVVVPATAVPAATVPTQEPSSAVA